MFLFETEQVVYLLSSLESFRLKATTSDKNFGPLQQMEVIQLKLVLTY